MNTDSITLEYIKRRAIDLGQGASVDEALALDARYTTDELCDAADEIRLHWCGDKVDTCSILNARSGRCGENCKWCAQSAHHHTGVAEYACIPEEEALEAAEANDRAGIKRFSLVTSGRLVSRKDIGYFCDIYRKISERTGLYLCASMGLLPKECLEQLRDAGVRRYHCNLETGSSYFPELCTTHTHADKLRTIAAAREAGLEICSGGIIGMGETMRQRLELAAETREAGACSIPINILNPIKGTALENQPLIGEDEIARSIALFRMIAPKAYIRFAGGRMRLSDKAQMRILHGGLNGALVGDMLTTIGNRVADDRRMFERAGLESGLREISE